ncbi:MAG: hypothetical protein WC346_11660 [Methanogenium sp.]|jgi:hypothetical protein
MGLEEKLQRSKTSSPMVFWDFTVTSKRDEMTVMDTLRKKLKREAACETNVSQESYYLVAS